MPDTIDIVYLEPNLWTLVIASYHDRLRNDSSVGASLIQMLARII